MTDDPYDSVPAPWRVSDVERNIDINGYIFAWYDEQPLFLRSFGTPDVFIAVFSTKAKLDAIHSQRHRVHYTIKQIDDAEEFLESIPLHTRDGDHLRVIVDPYLTESGTIRFIEIHNHSGVERGPVGSMKSPSGETS